MILQEVAIKSFKYLFLSLGLAKTVYILSHFVLLFLLPWIHYAIAFAKPYIRQQVFLEKSFAAVWVKRYEIVFA